MSYEPENNCLSFEISKNNEQRITCSPEIKVRSNEASGNEYDTSLLFLPALGFTIETERGPSDPDCADSKAINRIENIPKARQMCCCFTTLQPPKS